VPIPEIDRLLGIEVYATRTEGIGGEIRESADDFVVEEVLVDGSTASVNAVVPSQVLGSTLSRQQFLICVLIKRNWDTFIAVKNVAKKLGIDQSRIQFAGIKDARAVTAQHITIKNALKEDVRKLDIKDIELRPIGYVREMLSLFYLLGNKFTITIKSVAANEEASKGKTAQTIKELNSIGGIPNFFGHQRFGTTRPITHLVGKALSKGDFEEAAMLFLAKPSVHEHPASRQAREHLQSTGDFKQALQDFPKQLRFERIMLNHLTQCPSDFVGAIQRLPPKLQALFVQAYQSYLFNRFLSERLKRELPLNEAVVGDYVVAIERSGLPLMNAFKTVSSENLPEVNAQIKAGRLRVALPIVGSKRKLSQGVMGQVENEILEQEEATVEQRRNNDLSRLKVKGGLRTVITPVHDFKLQEAVATSEAARSQVKISFMLFRGCYATILLREIMKPPDPVAAGF
jgi:tRNA pseudouridine13 synthase